jgi:pyruvate/2-oxoglutarate dehydrogenase complex dihydrolipoamide dehydrogenase (E3) component
MPNVERCDDLIIGSGIAGKFAAWTRDSRRRTVIVERGLLGGACPNVACLPSKNLIWSAKVISLARRGMEFGLKTDSLRVDMAAVQRRKRAMVRELRKVHEDHTEASGADAEGIWAMGDCAGSPQFTHVGLDDYSIVHANLNGGKRTSRNRLIPFCMFTDPELARVGKNEVEARRDGIEYRLAKLPMAKCYARKRSPSRAAS